MNKKELDKLEALETADWVGDINRPIIEKLYSLLPQNRKYRAIVSGRSLFLQRDGMQAILSLTGSDLYMIRCEKEPYSVLFETVTEDEVAGYLKKLFDRKKLKKI